jgi:hypothetical protein
MRPDPEYLRQHYAALSDEALLEVDRGDLVETAQTIYDLEVRSRKLASPQDTGQPDRFDDEGETGGAGEEPDWLEEAAEVYGYAMQSSASDAPDAAVDGRDALEAAGIPCYLDLYELPREKNPAPYETHRWRLLVPGKMNLRAASVLERDIFNAEFEAGWKMRLEECSDEELREMNPQAAFCGLFDRIARVNKAYDAEIARRRLRDR